MDHELKFHHQTAAAVKKANRMLAIIKNSLAVLNIFTLPLLFKAFVRPLLLLLVVSLHQSDPLSDTFFCDIVVNHEIIKRACASQQRALEEMLHRLISFFTITRGVILIWSMVTSSRAHSINWINRHWKSFKGEPQNYFLN